MKASIVTIGDEILIGQVINTNAAWMAEQLTLLGILVTEIIVIPDNSAAIKQTLKNYEGNTDIVITTGGLGPTKDDITKNSLAEYFDSKFVFYPEVFEHIQQLFQSRGLKISEINKMQAMLPDNCRVLYNPSGTAQGMWFERRGTIFISLPGVPYEMMDITNLSLLHEFKTRINGPIIVHKTIMTQGIPESYLSERLKVWETRLPSHIKLAYLPKPGLVRLRLTASGGDREKLKNELEAKITEVLQIIPSDAYGFDDEPLEKIVADLIVSRNSSLSVAESCTGGNISRLITSIPGSSKFYVGSIIAYSDEIKKQFLGVSSITIDSCGAVSKEVVEEMAQGVRKRFSSDYSIATSGIAGPDGGTAEKPVGTTWIAVAIGKRTISAQYNFGEHRGRNIEKASYSALNMLRKNILDLS